MVLALDIGNTNIVIGGFANEMLTFTARIATNTAKTEDEYASKIKSILALHRINADCILGAVLSSVVPSLNRTMKKALQLAFQIDSIIVGPGVKTGLNIHCDLPSSVGTDLICASVCAATEYPAPILVIDMGTATKMMMIDNNKTFVGVSIIPGVHIALKALTESTAQLPQISLEAPKSIIGKNTADSMRSGVLFGNAAMIDGMIERFCDEVGTPLTVIATGGLANTVVPFCNHTIPIDDTLVLRGLYLIYQKNRPQNG